ncbi:hypothetical protein [Microbacterium sp. 2FI]|uniref:hypothetical protein n=1 Tax=Microbacterium sp. 2FI TaxID=2502193 RepID=UPI0010F53F50|nr:hypothetical protein [Microbacterium sp. 2FI]
MFRFRARGLIAYRVNMRVHEHGYSQRDRCRPVRLRVASGRDAKEKQHRQADTGNEPHYQQSLAEHPGSLGEGG